ncbi:MAG: hypothetical protein ACI3W5_03980 [Faecousia sp.]
MGFFILVSPFLGGFTLRVSDGDANLPQHPLVDLADCCSQRSYGGRGIEIKNCHKIFMVEIAFRFQPATGHEGVGNADSGGVFELYFDVKLIIFLQKGIVNDIEKVPLMLCPIFIRQFPGHIGELPCKIVPCNAVGALQHGRHGISVPFLHLPQPWGAGVFTGPGIRNIKNIAEPRPVPGIVHQGDTLGTAPDIPAHCSIPQLIFSAGGGVRALGIDHQLLMERILVKAGSGG